jgi:hypothetical protein
MAQSPLSSSSDAEPIVLDRFDKITGEASRLVAFRSAVLTDWPVHREQIFLDQQMNVPHIDPGRFR